MAYHQIYDPNLSIYNKEIKHFNQILDFNTI